MSLTSGDVMSRIRIIATELNNLFMQIDFHTNCFDLWKLLTFCVPGPFWAERQSDYRLAYRAITG